MVPLDKIKRPPGLVGDLFDWINDTAGKPQPHFALAASLTYVGALGGRLYRGPCGERTNLYCLAVGPSCCGKEHARTQIKRINRRAGIENLMGGEDVTSDAAIEMELVRQPRVLYLWDEIGHMFGNIKDAGSSGHRKNIVPMLMKLYSSADKTYEGKSYADRDPNKARNAIDQPCLCLYGTTVPERLYDSLDRGQLIDGFLSRCLLFETTNDPPYDRRRASNQGIPDDLVAKVAAFRNPTFEMEGSGADGDLVSAKTVAPKLVEFTTPALDRMIAFDAFAERMKKREKIEASGFDSLWGRASQNATKLALVVAIGCRSSVIDNEMICWACDLVTALISDLKNVVENKVADNATQRSRQIIMEVIRNAGSKGASRSEITRKTPTLKARERNELLQELVDDFGEAICDSIQGTRGMRYWLAKYGHEPKDEI